MFIDTHAHLDFPQYEGDVDEVITRAKEAHLSQIITISLSNEAIDKNTRLQEKCSGYIFQAAGLHPHDAKDFSEEYYQTIKKMAERKEIIAIGEIGLDYFIKESPEDIQREVFRKFLRLAIDLAMPVIIHSRDASEDMVRILKEEGELGLKGVLHCFSGDLALEDAALSLGLHLSYTGNLTFPKAENIRDSVKRVPLDRIMIETDSPFLAPQAFRGKRNEPAYVAEVAKKIAEIKGVSIDEVANQTSLNAKELFSLK